MEYGPRSSWRQEEDATLLARRMERKKHITMPRFIKRE